MTFRALTAAAVAVMFVNSWSFTTAAEPELQTSAEASVLEPAVDLFEAVEQGTIEMKFIAKSDRRARLILENKTDQEVKLVLPQAFAGVPVLGQNFGGGGRGGGGFGGGGGGGQGVGGGFGGGGGGNFGGGGGAFSVAPEKTARINMPVLCLDHGKRDPSSSKPYEMVPVSQYVENPAVTELLKAFGRGELQHGAAQAAVWALNNDISWQELAAKQAGTARDVNRAPYFSRDEIRAGMAYAQEAVRRAELAEQSSNEGAVESMSDESMADDPEESEPEESGSTEESEPESSDA